MTSAREHLEWEIVSTKSHKIDNTSKDHSTTSSTVLWVGATVRLNHKYFSKLSFFLPSIHMSPKVCVGPFGNTPLCSVWLVWIISKHFVLLAYTHTHTYPPTYTLDGDSPAPPNNHKFTLFRKVLFELELAPEKETDGRIWISQQTLFYLWRTRSACIVLPISPPFLLAVDYEVRKKAVEWALARSGYNSFEYLSHKPTSMVLFCEGRRHYLSTIPAHLHAKEDARCGVSLCIICEGVVL